MQTDCAVPLSGLARGGRGALMSDRISESEGIAGVG